MTREQWLNELAEAIRGDIMEASPFKLPEHIRVSCGWPSAGGLGKKKRTIGQCWSPEAEAGGKAHQIFISPYLGETGEVAATLVHELGHAAVGVDKKHNGDFKRFMKAVGLEGKATVTHAGLDLTAKLLEILGRLPSYPHSSLDQMKTTTKKQGTRMLKVMCPKETCGYTVRTTRKWLEVGVPTCHCGTEMVPDEPDDDDPIEPEEGE